jgi:uncharacterized membrane protein
MQEQVSANKKANKGPLQSNIEKILTLEKQSLQKLSPVEKLANKVTAFAGSTPCILLHLIWFGGWIVVNTHMIPGIIPFDPFPFGFLTLVVSLEAIFLTLLVLMSQNRMSKEADKRAQLTLQIDMLDEQETTLILRMVQKIANHLGLEEETKDILPDLSEATDIDSIAKKIDEAQL